jgi:Fe-S-cluster-containing dehydrogenase component
MNKQLFANPDLCTGCNRCTYICSATKEGKFIPAQARIHINNFPFKGYSVPSLCFQCPKADCLEACPTAALYRDEAGTVLVDPAKCTGCGACVDGCTYGMIELNTKGIAYKCDLCGGDPVCAKHCEPGALTFEQVDGDLVRLKAAQMKTRSKSGIPAEKRQAMARKLLKDARD